MLGGACSASFFAATTATCTESRAKSSRDIIFDFDIGTTEIIICAKFEEMSPDTLEQARDDVAASGHVWQCGAE